MNNSQLENLILYEEKVKIEIPPQYASKLVSLQRFGIRFLFKQFITKQPGVILNDPSGYGKRVQIILFLNAIKSLLSDSEPVLIVCQSVERWQQEFHAWSGNIDVVAMNATSFINNHKMYYITTFDNIKSHTPLKWSVVVIDYSQDDLINNYSKIVKGLKGLKGQFVVWISRHDIKLSQHLQVVSSIFEWMDKDFQIKFEVILSGIWRSKCSITRAIQLDRAFQDLYLRRDGLENKFSSEEAKQIESRPKITRKNKDSTGTKIKRSKRKINDEAIPSSDLTEIQQSNLTVTHDIVNTMSEEKSSQINKKRRSKRIISSDDDDEEVMEDNHESDKTNDNKLNNDNNKTDSENQNKIKNNIINSPNCDITHSFSEICEEIAKDMLKTEIVSNTNNIFQDKVEVDDELDELEKTVYNKYKGSLLDLL